MELRTTKFTSRNQVATILLSRPERHNAWTGRMHTELRHCLEIVDSDPSLRVVVIAGDPAGDTFCPGADGQALAGHAERGGYDPGTPTDLAQPGYGVRPEFDADFSYFLGLETMSIAAINGAVAGVGLALACWCDLRFAASRAKFTTAHGKLNLPAEYGLSWLLPRIVGLGNANDILLSSRTFDAEEALRMGLVNGVVPRGAVIDRALHYADNVVQQVSPHSLTATKRQIAIDTISLDPAESVNDAGRRLEQMMTENNYKEAARLFGSNQPPRWET